MSDIEDLITQMQDVKAAHPSLEIPDVLRIFSIDALNKLTNAVNGVRMRNG